MENSKKKINIRREKEDTIKTIKIAINIIKMIMILLMIIISTIINTF